MIRLVQKLNEYHTPEVSYSRVTTQIWTSFSLGPSTLTLVKSAKIFLTLSSQILSFKNTLYSFWRQNTIRLYLVYK